MEQIALRIVPKLTYKPDTFVVHRGVEVLVNEIRRGPADEFNIRYVVGGPRSGKTHLSIALSDILLKRGMYPHLLGGADFLTLLRGAGRDPAGRMTSKDWYLVDDAHLALNEILPGGSGPFVRLVEDLRLQRSKLLLFSSLPFPALPCDEHVLSRIRPGLCDPIGAPEEEELPAILDRIARQRGVALKPRNVQFVLRRVRRDIPALEHTLERMMHLSQVLGKSIKLTLLGDAVRLDQ